MTKICLLMSAICFWCGGYDLAGPAWLIGAAVFQFIEVLNRWDAEWEAELEEELEAIEQE